MRIQDIILENERASNSVEAEGPYSFAVHLAPGQKINLKSFVRGQLTVQTLFTHEGDSLIYMYDVNPQNVAYEISLVNSASNRKRIPEDGEFDLNSEEDLSLLKKDISVKMELFKQILEPNGQATVISIYKNILSKLD